MIQIIGQCKLKQINDYAEVDFFEKHTYLSKCKHHVAYLKYNFHFCEYKNTMHARLMNFPTRHKRFSLLIMVVN